MARSGLVLAVVFTGAAVAAPETYHSLEAAVLARPDCKFKTLGESLEYRCESDKTIWYFTRKSSAAHPAVLEFYFVDTPKGGEVKVQAWSAHQDSPAFQKWRAALVARNSK